jgi:hypothetical protein
MTLGVLGGSPSGSQRLKLVLPHPDVCQQGSGERALCERRRSAARIVYKRPPFDQPFHALVPAQP